MTNKHANVIHFDSIYNVTLNEFYMRFFNVNDLQKYCDANEIDISHIDDLNEFINVYITCEKGDLINVNDEIK
jgi:hypothetical protein